MIKRLSGNEPKIPVKDIEHKILPQSRVVDPTLTTEQKTELSKQVHQETFAQKALAKFYKQQHRELSKISDEEKEPELTDEEVAELLAQEEIRRGGKLFDPLAFQKGVAKTISPEAVELLEQSVKSNAIPHDPSRPGDRPSFDTEAAKLRSAERAAIRAKQQQEFLSKDKGLQKYIEDEPYYDYMVEDYVGIPKKDNDK